MYEYRKLTPEQRTELIQQRLAKGYPPHSPPHSVRDQPFYLLTATCYEHRHHMVTSGRRQQVLDALFQQFMNHAMEIGAWAVLPNHFNPVKHGWVQTPYDWPESSVHWYLEHCGREWLRDSWKSYPVRDYERGWDDDA